MQIREILQTDLNRRESIEGLSGSGEPETFFDAEDSPTNGTAELPVNPDESGTLTTLGNPYPRPSYFYLHHTTRRQQDKRAAPEAATPMVHPSTLPHSRPWVHATTNKCFQTQVVSQWVDGCVPAAERSSLQQRRASIEVASTSSSALSTQAEPKEAEVVQDEERQEERYNPVMW